jgi:large subunit ribosomal protein L35
MIKELFGEQEDFFYFKGVNGMPKLKTNKGAAKRFRLTSKGRVKRKKAYKSHILTKKAPKRKRALRKMALINKRDEKNIRRLIPYK